MDEVVRRDVEHAHGDTRMISALAAPRRTSAGPAVLLLHDAFGLSDDMLRIAHDLARLGFPVLAADVWGDRTLPTTQEEIGPLIGSMVSNRSRWTARLDAALAAAADQPEVDPEQVVALGYCFGGSSALELLRTGGRLRGAVSIHGGLDLLEPDADWSAADPEAHVLVCTGADDPMATAEHRAALESGLRRAGVDWEIDLYSDTRHAFTSPHAKNSPTPDAVAYHPRSAARSWAATTRFLTELFPTVRPVEH
ncbi:dienelactone hydrolase family protein [Isoptericola aurantiacus]|uniref:dienelactone hydrolase family protein n=1 Tax=Isoptericola aurantiacus TaxID=3377839 RepID=UPI00383B4850